MEAKSWEVSEMAGKKTGFFLAGLILALLLGPSSKARAASADSSPGANAGDEPFKPYYENGLELGSTNQQGGQSTGFFSYTGTFHLDEAGNFVEFGAQTSRQKIEGAASSTGSLILEGGLGLNVFNPSLAVNLGGGDQDWRQTSGDLTLGFQWTQDFSTDLSFGGSAGYHLGPASELVASLPGQALIDVTDANSALAFTLVAWDWWSISTTFELQNDGTNVTYQNHKYVLNQSDQVSTLTLGLDFTLFKGFVLDVSPQIGRIYYPAGISYSVETGGLVFNSAANVQNFVGATSSISYSFE